MGSPERDGAVFRVETADGWSLEVERVARPAATGLAPEARAACVVGHAMMASRRSLDRPAGAGLASTLAARGLAVYTFDARGHGGSGPRPRDGGAGLGWTYDDIVMRDVPAVVAAVRRLHPGLPLVVVGHSLVGHGVLCWLGQQAGAFASATAGASAAPAASSPVGDFAASSPVGDFAASSPESALVDAVVAIAAGVWIPALEPDPVIWWRKRKILRAWLALCAPLGWFPARALRVGSEDVSRPYIAQFVEWARSGAWLSVDGGRDYLAGLGGVRVPVLAIAGAADWLMCRPAAARAFADHLVAAPVTFRVVQRGEMPGLVPDHMGLVTARAALPLWHEIADWILRTVT